MFTFSIFIKNRLWVSYERLRDSGFGCKYAKCLETVSQIINPSKSAEDVSGNFNSTQLTLCKWNILNALHIPPCVQLLCDCPYFNTQMIPSCLIQYNVGLAQRVKIIWILSSPSFELWVLEDLYSFLDSYL